MNFMTRSLGNILAHYLLRMRNILTILIYHRVLDAPDPFYKGEVSKEEFRLHMSIVSSYFTVLPLNEALICLEKDTLPERSLCITFDDGYTNNFTNAFPILKEFGFSATFFIATRYIHGGMMWNDIIIETLKKADCVEMDLTRIGLGKYMLDSQESRIDSAHAIINSIKYFKPGDKDRCLDYLLEYYPVDLPEHIMMNETQIREMYECGMTMGAHTVTHPILRCITEKQAKDEIAESKEVLQQILDSKVELFAYPNGKPNQDYSLEHVEMVKKCGYKGAVTTSQGAAFPGIDIYQVPRFTPWDRSPLKFLFRLWLNGRKTPNLANSTSCRRDEEDTHTGK